MPYRKLTLSDGSTTPIRRIGWSDIANVVSPQILFDCQNAMKGSDRGKWTVYTITLESGNKLHVSNGREVLEF